MSWIRLDDQIGHHPKFIQAGLSSWIFVGCVGYAQKFLTDGFIPEAAVSSLCGGVKKPLYHVKRLVTSGLLELVKGGYKVHDYHDFNPTAAEVRKKRSQDRARKNSSRIPDGIHSESARIPQNVLARAPASHPIPSHPKEQEIQVISSLVNSAKGKNGSGSGGKEKPMFKGQRFVLFPWQQRELLTTLGAHAETFELFDWLLAVDTKAAENNFVVPKSEWWPWLQQQLLNEARRRGLPIQTTSAKISPERMKRIQEIRDMEASRRPNK